MTAAQTKAARRKARLRNKGKPVRSMADAFAAAKAKDTTKRKGKK